MNTVDKVIQVAMNEVGYLEKSKDAYKKNPDIIYDKTAGAGQDNITKYGKVMHDVYPSVMDFPAFWCDAFVDWCFYTAYGVTTAKSLLGGNFDDYTVNSCGMYKKHNALFTDPKIGDQVFFTKNGKPNGCHHTGIVYDVDTKYFYTIEGNTSGANGVISNGGGVAKMKYPIVAYKGRVLFGRPNYDKKSVHDIALECINGKYGVGETRKTNLKNMGYDPSEIQAEINAILKGKKIEDVPKYIWDYLLSKIGNPYGAAGLMGNLKAESGLNPKNLQNSCEKKLGMTDEQYVQAVDSGAYKNFVHDSCGFGLAQWTYHTRKASLMNFKGNKSIGDLQMQLDFLWKELTTSYKGVLNGLENAKSVREASDIVLTKFERPKDQSESVKVKRASYGQEFYDKYGGRK